jgi:hypothetical protein
VTPSSRHRGGPLPQQQPASGGVKAPAGEVAVWRDAELATERAHQVRRVRAEHAGHAVDKIVKGAHLHP